MGDETPLYVTEEGIQKAKQELQSLLQKRREIAKRIEAAKEMGDLSENAEYAQAKEEQGFVEGKIIELEKLLENAIVVNHAKGTTTVVEIGSCVVVQSNQGKQEYTIVGSSEADPLKGKISQASPLGEAFLGKKANDVVEVETPRGKTQYTIVAFE